MTNDNFADARVVTLVDGEYHDSQDGTGFTREDPDEPTFAGATSATAWWTFAPDADTTLQFDTFGSYFTLDPTFGDTTLAIYTGTALSDLSLLVGNDDADGGLPNNSMVTLDVTAGSTYFIQIGTYGADGLTFYYLNIAPPPPPPPPPSPPRPPAYPRRSFTS